MPDADITQAPLKHKRGLSRLWNALLVSLWGLQLAFRHEAAFRLEVAMAIVLIPLACLLPVSPVERVLLNASVLLVMVVELLNWSRRVGRARGAGAPAVPGPLTLARILIR
jgi:diacylglycerol kinase (ATP)